MKYDQIKVSDPAVQAFVDTFLTHRTINLDYYKRVPEEKYDFRMVNTGNRKSDSPRESIVHQTIVTRRYIDGIKTGKLTFGHTSFQHVGDSEVPTKQYLLSEFNNSTAELMELLLVPNISRKAVQAPWSSVPISAISCLDGLSSHEVLHTGWNLAIMDHLGIERFPSLQKMWG